MKVDHYVMIEPISLGKDGDITRPHRFSVRVMGERVGTAHWSREDAERAAAPIRRAIEAAVAECLAHGFAGCPVSDERLAEIHAYWETWEDRGQLPKMRRDRAELRTLVDWQRSVIAVMAGSPEGDDLKALLEQARREGYEERIGKASSWQ